MRPPTPPLSLSFALSLCLLSPLASASGTPPVPPPIPDPETATREDIEAYREIRKEWLGGLSPEQREALWNARRDHPLRTWPPGETYDWTESAFHAGVTGEEIARLRTEGFFVARDRVLKQSFEIYNQNRGLPYFITSDSLLNGFHVLLEATLQRAAVREAKLLREYLSGIWDAVMDPDRFRGFYNPEDYADEIAHIQRVLGPALVVLGETPEFLDEAVRQDVEETVHRIIAADTVWLPPWLAPAANDFIAIDFRRMRPVGFYNRYTFFQDHFRALQWLRAVPFRIDRRIAISTSP